MPIGDLAYGQSIKSFQSDSSPDSSPDFYFDEFGRLVFTEAYHLRRGHCCESGCRHCPYGFKK